MDQDEIVSGLVLELRRGTVVMLVLSQLCTPMYGYNLVKILADNDIPVEANTLYPLLRRLESQGLLRSEWETGGAKPRKYYMTTEAGNAVLQRIKKHWYSSVKSVNLLLEGDQDEQQ
ncbi:MAG: PadR family transcriptional regulator [Angelakisella sp.]